MNHYLDEHRLRIGLHTGSAPATVGGVAQQALRLMALLRELHPALAQGLALYRGSKEPAPGSLAGDHDHLVSQVLAQTARQWRDLYPKLELQTDGDGALLQQQALAKSMEISLGRVMPMTAPEFFSVMVNAVPPAKDLPGGDTELRLDMPRGPEPEFRNGTFLRQLLKQLIEAHPGTESAWVSSVAINRGTSCYGSYGVNLGWLTYVGEPELAGQLPEGVKWEPFADGVLIDLQDEAPGDDVSRIVSRAVSVRDALAPGGWLMVKRLRGLGYRLPYKVYDPGYGGTEPRLEGR